MYSNIITVLIFIIVLIVSFLGITYSFEYTNDEQLTFELIGPTNLYLDVNTEYTEYGIKVINNKIDISKLRESYKKALTQIIDERSISFDGIDF